MAAVHRARPSMGLQHELYRRSHRAPQPGEVHPEMLLDMLSMECQRRKHETSLCADEEEHLDIDNLVNEFKIDDSISACFADIVDNVAKTKEKKSKSTIIKQEEKLVHGEATSVEDEPTESNNSDYKASNKQKAVPLTYKLRLPTAMRIRLKCGKKFKRQQSEIDKIPYSTIQEQPEEELKCSSEELHQSLANKQVHNNSLSDGITDSSLVQERVVGNFVTNKTMADNSNTLDNSPSSKVEQSSHHQGLLVEKTNQAALPAPHGSRYGTHTNHSWNEDNDIGNRTFQSYQEDDNNKSGNGEKCTYHRADTDKFPNFDTISELFRQLESGSSDTKEILDQLLSSDDISAWRDDTGNNALHRCINAGNDQIMTIIATSHLYLTSEANHCGVLPVDMTVQQGHVTCLCAYISLSHTNTQISLTTDDVERLITTAIVGDQPKCLTILLKEFKRKSDERTFVVDKGGNSPGHVAAQLGRLQCLHVLYLHEFDLTACNGHDERPAHAADRYGHHFCFQFLVQVESEIKLVDQVVGRACIIDRLEHAISRTTQQIENNVQMVNQQLSFWTEAEQEARRELSAQVHKLCSLFDVRDHDNKRNDLWHILEKIERHSHRDPTECINSLRHLLHQILATSNELDNVQTEAQTSHESEVEAEERNVIIRSVHSTVEHSILGDGAHIGSSFDDKTESYRDRPRELQSNISPPRLLVNHDHRPLNSSDSVTASSAVPSMSTHLDADDESVTSFASLVDRLPQDFGYEDSTSRGDNRTLVLARSPRSYNSEMSDESSNSNWSSSESSASSSSRKWARFDHRRARERPSKMVYGMLLPDVHTRPSSSASSYTRHRHGASRRATGRQKRRFSLWDLRELRESRSKNIRLNIPDENLSDDILREHRIRQHVQTLHGSTAIKSDLVETITTASGEVYTEDLDRRYDPDFALHLTKNDNSCRGKMVRFSSDLNSNTLPVESCNLDNPSKTIQGSNHQCGNTKPKVNIFGLITKLAKRSKKNKQMEPSSSPDKAAGLKPSEKTVREYTRAEFVERYKPRSLTQAQDRATHMPSSSV
ncbi:uncharacterized protein LOC135476467 [Liolophura sinensis]|uniref:uncharacterized protein LOC135476467 n=1 Tax=Liolophura sinensis TaxID=3198878 RepID=UPI0031586620